MKFFVLIALLFTGLANGQPKPPTVQQQVWSITEVMYHDVISPPAAARFYAYAVLTGYEILTQIENKELWLQEMLKNYPLIKENKPSGSINLDLAVLYGILETGKNILPSGYLLEGKQEKLLNSFGKLSKAITDSSIAFAKNISKRIVQYAATDGYFKLSTLKRYRPFETDSSWRPTPPEYMAAIDPDWNSIRTFFLDSAALFKPAAQVAFSKEATSAFMQLTKDVYTTTNQLSKEQTLIANFWDCNPFAVQFEGHMSIGLKKISPGGHWMGITGIVCEQEKFDLAKTILLHTLVAMTLHDAFISCWDEKYRSNRIRPETVINRYIDDKWKPLLQTPPFPEYSSGHSVISTAAAEILTWFISDNFSFCDSTETYIGLPKRNFSSFRQAAAEARISRLYGGIHFRDAIDNGGEQGMKISAFIIGKLKR